MTTTYIMQRVLIRFCVLAGWGLLIGIAAGYFLFPTEAL